MELLILLLQRRGQLVSREEIVEKLWGKDVFVEDASINAAVRKIRTALKDDSSRPRYLETVVGKGYRFVGDLEFVGSSTAPLESTLQSIPPEPVVARARRSTSLTLLGFTALLGLIGVAAWVTLPWRHARDTHPIRIHSIAVLPLANLSGDPSQDYFADGMTDELITELAKIDAVRVISRTSVIRYRGTLKSLSQIAKELRVDTLVEGAVVRSGDRLRITAQLIEASTDRHLWADSYERNFSDVLALQREIAGTIATKVSATLRSAENGRLANGTILVNGSAHEAYLRGLFFWNKWTEESIRKSVGFFQQAIQADPNYALAYAGLADSYIALGDLGVGLLPPNEANAAAERAALKAISLDESLAEGHAALALSRLRAGADLSDVDREFRRATELNPNSATAHHWYSHYLLAVGRSEEAIAEGERAYDLSPVDPEMGVHMQFVYLFLHRYEDVLDEGRKALELDPNFAETHWMNGQAYELKHMYKEASSELRAAVDLSGRRTVVLASFGHFLAVSGDGHGARKILAELDALSRQRYVPSYDKAVIQVGLGDDEAALVDLSAAYKEGSYWMFVLQSDARFDPLRSDHRLQDILRRVPSPQRQSGTRLQDKAQKHPSSYLIRSAPSTTASVRQRV